MSGIAKTTNFYKIALLFTCLLLLTTLTDAGTRKINCRKYVHIPECRGIAAKRDTSRFTTEDYRPFHENTRDLTEVEKASALLNDDNSGRSLLRELLRKLVSDRNEYDTGTNYLK